MIKSELVRKLASENPHLYPRDIEKIVSAILGTIADALAREDRVELRGFGTFAVKRREARQRRNPRTGEAVAVPGKLVPAFKTGRKMHHRLNSAPTSPILPPRRQSAPSAKTEALIGTPL